MKSPTSIKWIAAGLAVILFALMLLAWAPWLSPEQAGRIAVDQFTSTWQDVADGCGFNCSGCGVKSVAKTWFGYSVTLEFACGLLPADLPEYHQVEEVFVSFIGR